MDKPTHNKFSSLQDKPKDEKTVIAGGIAVTVVAVLLLAWGIWFLKKIANEQPVDISTAAYDMRQLRGSNVAPLDSGQQSGSAFGTPSGDTSAPVPSKDSGYYT